ncbi:hypothetical protein ARMGADRAFT_558305 [Armillaria gallica]|uniref:Uncharacterized protein n=1 Tax=Armillaria gallica TaxID=47427 RepID=A0A2H3CR31_ARMGA|nr:hypothetical protein ARMGADRAFT_558305 [Armillaria gallica]
MGQTGRSDGWQKYVGSAGSVGVQLTGWKCVGNDRRTCRPKINFSNVLFLCCFGDYKSIPKSDLTITNSASLASMSVGSVNKF